MKYTTQEKLALIRQVLHQLEKLMEEGPPTLDLLIASKHITNYKNDMVLGDKK